MRPLCAFIVAAALLSTPHARAETWVYTTDFALVLPQVGNGAQNVWWYSQADFADRDGDYPLSTISNNGYYAFAGNAFHYIASNFVHPGTYNFANPASNPMPDCVIEFRAPSTISDRTASTVRHSSSRSPTVP